MRFGMKMQASEKLAFLAPYTFNLRIHHAYIGLIMAFFLASLIESNPVRTFLRRVGIALILSDLIHHFVVLRLITGSAQFEWFYPG